MRDGCGVMVLDDQIFMKLPSGFFIFTVAFLNSICEEKEECLNRLQMYFM